MKKFVTYGVLLYVFVFLVAPEFHPRPQGTGDISLQIAEQQIKRNEAPFRLAYAE